MTGGLNVLVRWRALWELRTGGCLSRHSRAARASEFAADRSGAAALEVGLLALPFFTIVFAIIELGLLFFTSASLEAGANAAARRVRTGEVSVTNLSRTDFAKSVCEFIEMGNDCEANIIVEVRPFASFVGMDQGQATCVEGAGEPAFDPGQPGDIMMVRVCYAYSMKIPLMGGHFANIGDDKRGIVSTAIFRNEPFGDLLPEA